MLARRGAGAGDVTCRQGVACGNAPTSCVRLSRDGRRMCGMSGPGLTQRDAHHAIHQAAFHDAERLMLLLRRALGSGD